MASEFQKNSRIMDHGFSHRGEGFKLEGITMSRLLCTFVMMAISFSATASVDPLHAYGNEASNLLDRMELLRRRIRTAHYEWEGEYEIKEPNNQEEGGKKRRIVIEHEVDFLRFRAAIREPAGVVRISFEGSSTFPGTFFDIRTLGLRPLSIVTSNSSFQTTVSECLGVGVDRSRLRLSRDDQGIATITSLSPEGRRIRLSIDEKRGATPIHRIVETGTYDPKNDDLTEPRIVEELHVAWKRLSEVWVPVSTRWRKVEALNVFGPKDGKLNERELSFRSTFEWKSVNQEVSQRGSIER